MKINTHPALPPSLEGALTFSSKEERQEVWESILAHYGCQDTERNYSRVTIIPEYVPAEKRSAAMRRGKGRYRPVVLSQSHAGAKIRLSGNLSHREALALKEECWKNGWPT